MRPLFVFWYDTRAADERERSRMPGHSRRYYWSETQITDTILKKKESDSLSGILSLKRLGDNEVEWAWKGDIRRVPGGTPGMHIGYLYTFIRTAVHCCEMVIRIPPPPNHWQTQTLSPSSRNYILYQQTNKKKKAISNNCANIRELIGTD